MPHSRRRFVTSLASALPTLYLQSAEVQTQPKWQAKLTAIRDKYQLPGLGAALVTKSGLHSLAVAGVRKAGTEIAVSTADLWHLGSNTKAMTSTLAAIAVESGKLNWQSTVAEIFPTQPDVKKSPLARATLTQLLSHWSGLPANAPWGMLGLAGADCRAQRATTLQFAARTPDLAEPGKVHLYSNLGYVIAGHMLETVLDAPWEDLMQKKLFKPLGIHQAGFGGTGTAGQVNQPWPHQADGSPMPSNGPLVDNPAVLGPAGTVHLSLADWARFITPHLIKDETLLKKTTWQHLHTPTVPGNPYAFGWLAVDRQWGGRVLNHGGSNTMNHSVTWLAPEKGFAMLACTNTGSDVAAKALDDVAGMLIRQSHEE
jgi:CubicO group peptidase (beta-lactamase class C family)